MNKNKNSLNNFTKNIFEIAIVFFIIKSLNNNKINNREILSTSILIYVALCFIKNIFEIKNNNNEVSTENNDKIIKKNLINLNNNTEILRIPNNNSIVDNDNEIIRIPNNNSIVDNDTEIIRISNDEEIINMDNIEDDIEYVIEKSSNNIYNNVNNDNRIKITELENFTNNIKNTKDKYLDIDNKIKKKFSLNSINKIQLEDGTYIINNSLETYGYNDFTINGDKLSYSDSNKKYTYTFDKKLRRYVDNEYNIIFLKNKDFFIDQDLDRIYYKKNDKNIEENVDKEMYLAEIEDLDKEITENAKIRYYTYRKYLDEDGVEKYKLINNKYYDKEKNDKVLIDLNTLPHDKRQEKYDKNKIYGYSYVPPNKWYDVPSRKQNCITSDDGPFIRPVLSDGTPYDVLYWQKEIEKK